MGPFLLLVQRPLPSPVDGRRQYRARCPHCDWETQTRWPPFACSNTFRCGRCACVAPQHHWLLDVRYPTEDVRREVARRIRRPTARQE